MSADRCLYVRVCCSSSIFAHAYTARVVGIGTPKPLAELDDRADDRFELHRPARLEILQHRRLVRADFFGARHPLVDRDRQLDAELRRHRFGFRHDFADRRGRVGMPDQLFERPAGQRADRVERDVAEQLHPDLVAKPRVDRDSGTRRQSTVRRSLRNRSDLLPSGSPKLILLPSVWRMTPGSTMSVGKVGERADHPTRLDAAAMTPPGSTRSSRNPSRSPPTALEVPPRDAVLRADDDGVGTEERCELRRERRQAVRLDAEEYDVGLSDRRKIAGDLRPHLEVAVRARHAQPVLLHGAQVRTAREQHDSTPGAAARASRAPI